MTRIPAHLTEAGYHAANQAFQEFWSGDHDELLDVIKAESPAQWQGAELRVLSIGAGDGRRDLDALRTLHNTLTPSKLHFTALEPNSAQLQALQTRFQASSLHINLTLLQQSAESYDFPPGSFDLILFTHSLYHMPGAERDVLAKAVGALKPGGRVIVALSTEQGGIFQMMGAYWQTIDYSHFETGDGLFGQESLLKILEEDYAPEQYKFTPLPDIYIDVSASFDANAPMGKDVLNFVMQADCSKLPDDVRAQVLETLGNMAPQHEDGTRRLPHGSGLAVIYGV